MLLWVNHALSDLVGSKKAEILKLLDLAACHSLQECKPTIFQIVDKLEPESVTLLALLEVNPTEHPFLLSLLKSKPEENLK